MHPLSTRLLAPIALVASPIAVAQAQSGAASAPPGPPAEIVSMGQPSRWHAYGGVSMTATGLSGETAMGGAAFLGLSHPLINPIVGGPTLALEGYLGAAGSPVQGADGGIRAGIAMPILFMQAGLDWNFRINRAQFMLSATIPPVRGGLFGRGGQLRIDWIPARDHTLQVGVTMPIASRWAGRTRPRKLHVDLPRGPRSAPPIVALDAEGEAILAHVHDYTRRVAAWGFPISWTEGDGYQDALHRADSIYTAFAASLRVGDALSPGGHSAPGDRAVYLRETDRLLGWAAGDPTRGPELGDSARRAVLDEVWLPYNRVMAQYKKPDQLLGLGARARRRFAEWVGRTLPAATTPRVLAAVDGWFAGLEGVRKDILARGRGDSRGTWLPMQLVLRPEDHDTQEEIDAILARAVGADFSRGNAAIYLAGQQFQSELHGQIMATRQYHVLWVHDFRGLNAGGYPDLIGFYQTAESYLAALTAHVRAYDRTGTLPVYMIFNDENYYEANGTRLWFDILEHPLSAEIELPAGPKTPRVSSAVATQLAGRSDSLQERLRAWQDSLRSAVAGSARLQADAARQGGQSWLERAVKIHVSVTQPVDFTFRTSHLLGLPIASDNLIRDHRKIAFHDVTERDPASGSAMFAGVGVGEHYTTPTWEDRALLVQGPALVRLKTAARELLEANGFKPEEIPAPLRAEPSPDDYAERVAALEAGGATARILQVHNRVGFAQKDATLLQMLLYDLMPAGSVIYVPDSIWTSFLWTGQLVAAAFRGCHVYIVAPAASNAPSAAPPTLARTQELYAQLVVIRRVLGDAIEANGGRLRVGLYTRESGTTEMVTSFREIARRLREHPEIREEFALGDTFFNDFEAVADSLDAAGFTASAFLQDVEDRAPKLHRKTQFFGSRALLQELAGDARVLTRYRADMRNGVRSKEQPPAAARIVEDPRVIAELPLLEAFEDLPEALRDSAPLYMSVGSLNKDWRGAALDGEALAVISGKWALIGWIDFLYLAGHTTWLDSEAELEQLLPPASGFQRWVGKRLRNLI